jgi:trk system potassium uptake protein TrkH
MAIMLLLWIAGMPAFSAFLHGFTVISCGGFSSSDQSVGHWHNPGVDWVVLIGMLIGGGPFPIYWQALRYRRTTPFGAVQIRWFLSLIAVCSAAISLWLIWEQDAKPLPALRHALFAVTSVMTGSGFATMDWSRWNGFPMTLFFLLTFIGGCAGSTAGGIKIFRVQILLTSVRQELLRFLRPNAVNVARFDGRAVPDMITESVLGYLFVFTFAFALLALGLGLTGMGFMPAMAASAGALANLGVGAAPQVGPLASFATLPVAAKWLLCGGMLFGRLELFLVLALFSKGFWKE